MNRRITLRPVEPQDETFLYNLYKFSRADEFAIAGLSEMQFDALLRMQYGARKASYESNFPRAQHDIVVVDGLDAGQIWVARDQTQMLVVDISIAKAFQDRGIGTAVMTELIAEAKAAGLLVRCSVATNNPGSLRFHKRLGFRITSQDEMYYKMELATSGLAS